MPGRACTRETEPPMTPVALSKSADLFQKFMDFWEKTKQEPPNEFELRRFEKEARALQSSDPVIAYSILGTLATLRGDEAETRSCFENALRFASNDVSTLFNYSVAMYEHCRFSESEEFARRALTLSPLSVVILDWLIVQMTHRGRIQTALEFLALWQQLKPNEEHPLHTRLLQAQALIRDQELNPDEVARMFENSMEQANRIVPGWKAYEFQVFYPEYIAVDIIVDADSEKVADFSWDLAKAKAEPPFSVEVILHTSISFRSRPGNA